MKRRIEQLRAEVEKEGKKRELAGKKKGEKIGIEKGKREGKKEAIESLLKQGLITKDQAAKALKELQ